ncbi:MAG TPA: hypothetical protein VM422_11540 [Amaricoccus sp.]|nr:hypothetical protein [Amaricoccus sp.]
MTMPTPAATALIPPCARLAAICAAVDGRTATCPAAMQRRCATLAALRRITGAEQARSAS